MLGTPFLLLGQFGGPDRDHLVSANNEPRTCLVSLTALVYDIEEGPENLHHQIREEHCKYIDNIAGRGGYLHF